MKTLTLHEVTSNDELVRTTNANGINLESSALFVFIDFEKSTPRIIDWDASAAEADLVMKKTHSELLSVVDDNEHFLGVVTRENLNDQEIIKRLQHGIQRSDLSVADFMLNREKLKSIALKDLAKNTIATVVDTLKLSGERFCLVIDGDAHSIRGLVSADDIARKLNLPINISHDSSFVGVFKAINAA